MPVDIPASAVGAFEDVGGAIIRIEWNPDLDRVSQALLRAAGDVENILPPLVAARRIARDDMEQHFATETDPEGDRWEDLDPKYAAFKEAHGGNDTILDRYGDMRAAATSEDAWEIIGNEMFFNAAGLPPYALTHQTGTTGSKTHSGEFSNLGRGGNLPQRMFIGLSDQAEAEILDVFDLWFSEAIDIHVHTTGWGQQRVAGGRFGQRVF